MPSVQDAVLASQMPLPLEKWVPRMLALEKWVSRMPPLQTVGVPDVVPPRANSATSQAENRSASLSALISPASDQARAPRCNSCHAHFVSTQGLLPPGLLDECRRTTSSRSNREHGCPRCCLGVPDAPAAGKVGVPDAMPVAARKKVGVPDAGCPESWVSRMLSRMPRWCPGCRVVRAWVRGGDAAAATGFEWVESWVSRMFLADVPR